MKPLQVKQKSLRSLSSRTTFLAVQPQVDYNSAEMHQCKEVCMYPSRGSAAYAEGRKGRPTDTSPVLNNTPILLLLAKSTPVCLLGCQSSACCCCVRSSIPV